VAERTRGAARTILMLSGGLDSSIVAACLSAAGRDFAGLTFVTDNPAGDERCYARAVSDRFGITLLEGRCAVDDVDLRISAAAPLPRPVARSFEQGTNRLVGAAAQEISAGCVVNGSGGDNLFCSLQSPGPVADCLLDPAGKDHFWRVARDMAEITEASVWKVARRAWARARSRRPFRREPDHTFLTTSAVAVSGAALAHPWLLAPPDILPGKSAHVALLIGAQGLVEDRDPRAPRASSAVLISQPLIETCLRIPSWRWCNRAAARHAFATDLPPDIAWRRSKGTPDSYLVQIFDAHRALVRDLLLNGLLAELGVLDRAAIAAMIDDPRPVRGHAFARIMQLADAEIWARGWPLR